MRSFNFARGGDVTVQRVGQSDQETDNILANPHLNSRNKVFALATAHERLDNMTRPYKTSLPNTENPPILLETPPVVITPNSYLEQRTNNIVNTVGKPQKHNAEKLLTYLHDIGMDISQSMEPVLDQTILVGANISELVHWVTNPLDQPFRPRRLESFMRILSQHHMPATMVTNKNRRLMYTSLKDEASFPTGLVRKPSEVHSKSDLVLSQDGNGLKWTFY